MNLERLRPETCLSDLILDRLSVGELEGTDHAARAAGHLEACAPCRDRLQLFKANVVGFKSVTPLRRRWLPPSVGLAAAAYLGGIVVAGTLLQKDTGVRTKGGLAMQIVAKRQDSGRVEALFEEARLSPGDAIRFKVSTEHAGYLAIVGLDSAQSVSVYYPEKDDEARIEPREQALLDGSIVLDTTLGPERIVALLCARPLEQNAVRDAGRAALSAAAGDPGKIQRLPIDCAQTSVLLQKVER
jgi:hypothetical protein